MSSPVIQVISLALHLVILSLLMAINRVIHKACLQDHQYYIIRILSLTDAFFSCTTITFATLLLAGLKGETLRVVIGFLGYLLYCTSLLLTALLTLDRLIAVKYCLYYRTYVTRKRINIAVLLATCFSVLVLFSILIWDESEEIPLVWWTTKSAFIYVTSIRLFVCQCIIITGKITMNIRKENEVRLKSNTQNLRFGVKAENLKKLQKLKRSVKDIIHLNFWTCIFLIPNTTVTLLMLFDVNVGWSKNGLALANVFAFTLQSLSNPIVYATSFSKIRNYLFISRRRVKTNSESTT